MENYFTWTHEGIDYKATVDLTHELKIISQDKVNPDQVAVIPPPQKEVPKEKKKCTSCEQNRNVRSLRSLIKGGAKLLQSELGIKSAEESLIIDRRNFCESCEHYDFGVCNQCGCFCSAKVRLKSEKCPIGIW